MCTWTSLLSQQPGSQSWLDSKDCSHKAIQIGASNSVLWAGWGGVLPIGPADPFGIVPVHCSGCLLPSHKPPPNLEPLWAPGHTELGCRGSPLVCSLVSGLQRSLLRQCPHSPACCLGWTSCCSGRPRLSCLSHGHLLWPLEHSVLRTNGILT
jgi:hypothetical protein